MQQDNVKFANVLNPYCLSHRASFHPTPHYTLMSNGKKNQYLKLQYRGLERFLNQPLIGTISSKKVLRSIQY